MMSFANISCALRIFSFIGWAYETVILQHTTKKICKQRLLSTCFCPIYGMGAMLDLILLGWIENPLILFFAGMVVTCSLEYFVSWLLETLFHKRWWDYTGWPGNINGRVCLIGGIAFGTFTVALIKLIAPVTIDMIDSVSLPALHIMTCVIAFVMIADTVKTVKCMDSSKLWYVEKQAEFMDELRNGRCVGLVKKIKDTFRR